MIVKHFPKVLYITGVITMVPILYFFLPWPMFNLNGMVMTANSGVAFAKHWGLLAACMGGLLFYSASHPELRRPVVIAAAIEKMGLCVIVIVGWTDPGFAGFHPVVFIDGLCVALYGLWLLSGGDHKSGDWQR
jgi:hypothetical protein